MTLKTLLNEIESQDADFNKREAQQDAWAQEEYDEYNNTEVNIITINSKNDDEWATVNAVIGFDKNGYVVLSHLTIEDDEEIGEFKINLSTLKAKAEDKLNKSLSNEIEVKL